MGLPATRHLRGSDGFYAGDDYRHEITFVDENEAALDYSGRTWAAQLRLTEAATDSVDLTVDATDAADGIVVVTLAHAATATLGADIGPKGVWDLQATLTADGTRQTLLAGEWELTPDVTR